MSNVCPKCGITTAADRCPNHCPSNVEKGKDCNTIPWAMIPKNCWDCGATLTQPPHKRAALGQCEDCAKAWASKFN